MSYLKLGSISLRSAKGKREREKMIGLAYEAYLTLTVTAGAVTKGKSMRQRVITSTSLRIIIRRRRRGMATLVSIILIEKEYEGEANRWNMSGADSASRRTMPPWSASYYQSY